MLRYRKLKTLPRAPNAPVAATIDHLDHSRLSQGLPLLLPPGRILHLRPHRKESSATRLGGNTSPAPYTLVELSPGQTFRRLVLGRSCLEDHQCRAYRRVLAALARH